MKEPHLWTKSIGTARAEVMLTLQREHRERLLPGCAEDAGAEGPHPPRRRSRRSPDAIGLALTDRLQLPLRQLLPGDAELLPVVRRSDAFPTIPAIGHDVPSPPLRPFYGPG